MKLYTRDWLDSKELRRCSAAARGILADLMCLAHEGSPYGYLADKLGPLSYEFMASRCIVPLDKFKDAISELERFQRIQIGVPTVLYIPRMIEDEESRLTKAAAGRKGGNPNLVKGEVNHHHKVHDKVARAPADSVSVSDSGFVSKGGTGGKSLAVVSRPSMRFPEWWAAYPLKQGENVCAGVWTSIVTVENEAAVFACMARYLASDHVARGVVKAPNNWLHDCSRDNWASDWPKKTEANRKKGFVEGVAEVIGARMAKGEPAW